MRDIVDALAKVHELLDLDGSVPKEFRVVETTPEGHATQTFSVVADYGWAERVLCDGSYEKDAEAIAESLRAMIA